MYNEFSNVFVLVVAYHHKLSKVSWWFESLGYDTDDDDAWIDENDYKN